MTKICLTSKSEGEKRRSELHSLADVDESLAHAALDQLVHRRVLGADQALKLVVGGVDGVSEPFLVEIRRKATHALDKRLWGAQVPMHEAW